ncbi:MAG: hypothetical protein IKQ75_03670 [Bacteroidales bacterium]|nr:hypothetical protein [Bacteroidales bacterium]
MIINVECKYCGKSFNKIIDENSLTACSSDTRSMGEEKHYMISVECKCPCCKKELKQIDVYEYPEGIYTAFAE